MKRQQVTRNNRQSKNETPLVRGILQRAAVHSQDEESSHYSKSRFHQDFSQVPVMNTAQIIQSKSAVSEEDKSNKTGLPDQLKAGIENLSGIAMDDVRVHYNSPKPSQLQALAYAQGTDIHIAPGQEKHLPHEAWHVVQQKQGRVNPTIQVKGVAINDNKDLENEADVMGETTWNNAGGIQKMPDKGQLGWVNSRQMSIQAKMEQPIEKTIKKGSKKGEAPSFPKAGDRKYTKQVNEEREDVRSLFSGDTRLTTENLQVIRAHIIPHSWGGPDDTTNVVPWRSDDEEAWENKQKDKLEKFKDQVKDQDANFDIKLKGTAEYSSHLTKNWLKTVENRIDKLQTVEGKKKLKNLYEALYAKRILLPSQASLYANDILVTNHQDTSGKYKIDINDERVKKWLDNNGWIEKVSQTAKDKEKTTHINEIRIYLNKKFNESFEQKTMTDKLKKKYVSNIIEKLINDKVFTKVNNSENLKYKGNFRTILDSAYNDFIATEKILIKENTAEPEKTGDNESKKPEEDSTKMKLDKELTTNGKRQEKGWLLPMTIILTIGIVFLAVLLKYYFIPDTQQSDTNNPQI